MSMANWAELPFDVLEHLTSFLPLKEYLIFGAVCQNWHLVAKQKRHPPAEQLPLLVLGEDSTSCANQKQKRRMFFNLSENKHYYIDIPELRGRRICGSSYGWLFTLDIELNFSLLNPFTRKCYNLPPLPPYDRFSDISTYRKAVDPDDGDSESSIPTCTCTFAEMQTELVYKAILDHDPTHSSDQFKVMILYGAHRSLACWRPDDLAWTKINIEGGHRPVFDDIIFFKQNFYAVGSLSKSCEIYIINIYNGLNPEATRVEPLVPLFRESFCYLVDLKGELLLMQRWFKRVKEELFVTKRIIVYQVNLEEGKYCECKSNIDGHAIFMGANSSVVVDTYKFTGCTKNALYFTDIPVGNSEKYGCKDLWIYDMSKSSFSTYYSRKTYIPVIASPIWLTPNL